VLAVRASPLLEVQNLITRKMIKQELPIKSQQEILNEMFGFNVVDESLEGQEPHYVVYDEEGNEFYGSDENCQYDLSTIGGIIRYAQDKGEKTGYWRCQNDMLKVLGID